MAGKRLDLWEYVATLFARVASAARETSVAITKLEVAINVARLDLEDAKRKIRRERLAKRKRKPARRRRRARGAEEAQG